MKLFRAGLIFSLSLALVFSAGCQKTKVTLGEMEGNKYSNDFFGLSIEKPESWVSLSQAELAELSQTGKEAIGEYNEKIAEKIDLESERNLNLFGFWKYPLDHIGDNANIGCAAENLTIAGFLKIKTGADYLSHTRDLIIATGMPYEFGQISSEKLGGKEFAVLPMTFTMYGVTVKQKYYARIIKGYAISIYITYSTDSELETLQGILDTIEITQ